MWGQFVYFVNIRNDSKLAAADISYLGTTSPVHKLVGKDVTVSVTDPKFMLIIQCIEERF